MIVRTRLRRDRRLRGGLTLLEVIVALGVFAVGATAAFSLLVAAAAAGRRAEHEVNAALIAETVINDLKGYPLTPQVLDGLPALDATAGSGATSTESGAGAAPTPPAVPSPAPSPATDFPAPPAAATGPSRYLERDRVLSAYPDYRFDIVVTPLEGPLPDEPWAFLIEVEVRWSQRGRRRSHVFQTVLVRTLSHLDNPAPTPGRP